MHRVAATGFAASAKGYARGRPDYPPALETWLRDSLGLAPGRSVLDLGAGTGKVTPLLLATRAQVLAVEPVPEMLSEFAAAFPSVATHAGTADAIPFPDGSVDAVLCAQSFHWFATAAALAEVRRVLAPDGVLGLVWNVRDDSVPWVARLTEIITPYEGDAPRFAKGDWRRAFPAIGFGPLEETVLTHVHVGPPERVIVDRFLSVSFIAALPLEKRAEVARQLRQVIAEELTDEVVFPYRTVAYRCQRR